MELKHSLAVSLRFLIGSINRTFMELKHLSDIVDIGNLEY